MPMVPTRTFPERDVLSTWTVSKGDTLGMGNGEVRGHIGYGIFQEVLQ